MFHNFDLDYWISMMHSSTLFVSMKNLAIDSYFIKYSLMCIDTYFVRMMSAACYI